MVPDGPIPVPFRSERRSHVMCSSLQGADAVADADADAQDNRQEGRAQEQEQEGAS